MAVVWDAEFILSIWGLRQGKALRDPCRISTGGVAGPDDEWQAVRYVETTFGFERVRPLLAWVYVQCKPLELFRVRGPGEPLARALLAKGWGNLLGLTENLIACRLHDEFVSTLRHRLVDQPFVPFRPEKKNEEKCA